MKKILCFVLSVLIVLPVIASCSNKNNSNQTTPPSDLKDETPEQLYGEYDLQEQNFVLLIES